MAAALTRLAFPRLPRFGAALLLAAALGGCSNQGEGELCSTQASGISGDCASGLTCQIRANALNPNAQGYGVCCPANGQGTVGACTSNTTIGNNPAPSEGDAGDDGGTATGDGAAPADDAAGPDAPAE